MSRQAWRYDALERNTKLIREFCEKYKFQIKELSPYQFRVEDVIDLYPVRQNWHWLASGERGTFLNTDNLKAIILEHMPEAEEEAPSKVESKNGDGHITIDGKLYELGSFGPAYSDGSRQATLREVKTWIR